MVFSLKDSEFFFRENQTTSAYQREFGKNKKSLAPQSNILRFKKIKNVKFEQFFSDRRNQNSSFLTNFFWIPKQSEEFYEPILIIFLFFDSNFLILI